MKIIFILAKSAGPDEMQHIMAFHLGLHCLPKYPLKGFQYTKGKRSFSYFKKSCFKGRVSIYKQVCLQADESC